VQKIEILATSVQDVFARSQVVNEMSPHQQHSLSLDLPLATKPQAELSVLDLFSGIGGLAAGFKAAGFSVAGADVEEVAGKVFAATAGGEFVYADLSTDMVYRDVEVVTGGPPCRPWSAVNQQRRRDKHEDHHLLMRYFDHVREIRPVVFLMENVPPVGSDPLFRQGLDLLRSDGYRCESHLVRYSDYGGASARTRRFTVGFRDSFHAANEFFVRLRARRATHSTVRQAIYWARELQPGAVPDHDWSQLRTIEKYLERYQTGRFGWTHLDYDLPAPSFGSVAKTYILHPEAGVGSFPMRVLSVREAMCIMDFESHVSFPAKTPRAKRYQMIANAVSPRVAAVCASVIRELLTGEASAAAQSRQNQR
jgi:DNA (cytosine-5)-methyltransferase 1